MLSKTGDGLWCSAREKRQNTGALQESCRAPCPEGDGVLECGGAPPLLTLLCRTISLESRRGASLAKKTAFSYFSCPSWRRAGGRNPSGRRHQNHRSNRMG